LKILPGSSDKEQTSMKATKSIVGCIVIACLVTACGVTPTRIGEGVRGVIDRTEDKRSDSDAIIYYPKPDK
jgi:hypothetical protein